MVFIALVAFLFTVTNCQAPLRKATPPVDPTLITGIVKDSNGSALGHASVKAVKKGSNFTASSTTDSSGEYILKNLETGTYQVTASLYGYLPSTRETELSTDGDQARIDFELQYKPNR